MSWMEIIADRKIRDAMDEGVFENLPGKGKPLNLDQDPRVPPEQRAAYRLMKEAQFLPDWIQADKEIRVFQEGLEARIARFRETWQLNRESLLETAPRSRRLRHDHERDQFLYKTALALVELNRRIDHLNLIVPTLGQQRLRVDVNERMTELEDQLPRLVSVRSGEAPGWQVVTAEKKAAVQLANRMPLRRKRNSFG